MKTGGKLVVKKKFDVAKKVATLHNATIKIGYPKESNETHSEHEGVTALHKATVNNFGLGVPRRPFMGVSFEKNKGKYNRIVEKQLSDLERLDYEKFLNKLGLLGSQDVKQAIIELRTPPNSAATIKAKGSSNPLVDTAHMMQSTTYQIVG